MLYEKWGRSKCRGWSYFGFLQDIEQTAPVTPSTHVAAPTINTEEVVSKMKTNFTSHADFDLLAKRVAKMENTFSELTTKVDGIIIKLDQIGQKQKQVKYDQFTTKQTSASDSHKKSQRKWSSFIPLITSILTVFEFKAFLLD